MGHHLPQRPPAAGSSLMHLNGLWLTAALVAAAPSPAQPPEPPVRIAVLSIDLNNLHKTEPDSSLAGRIRNLQVALRDRLASHCGYQVVSVDSSLESAAHLTSEYFYQHPEVAAEVARRSGADWVVVPRLNRASAWAADLQAHLVRVRDSVVVSNRIVELKGMELTPELAARLGERGAAWMADQLSQALELARQPEGSQPVRRCAP